MPRVSAASCQCVPPSLARILHLSSTSSTCAGAAAVGGPSSDPSCGASLLLPLATNAASIAVLASLGFDFFFVAAVVVYGPRFVPFFTPDPQGGDRRDPS